MELKIVLFFLNVLLRKKKKNLAMMWCLCGVTVGWIYKLHRYPLNENFSKISIAIQNDICYISFKNLSKIFYPSIIAYFQEYNEDVIFF